MSIEGSEKAELQMSSEKLSYYDDSFGENTITEKNLFDDEEALKIFLSPITQVEPMISTLACSQKKVDETTQQNLSQLLDYIKSYLGYLRPHHQEISSYIKNFIENIFLLAPSLSKQHQTIFDRISFLENRSVDQQITR